VWIYRAVSDVMASRRLYSDDQLAVYRVYQAGVQVYALDENFQGTLVTAVPEDAIGVAGTYEGENGWTVEYVPGDEPRTYEITVTDADGETLLSYPAE